MKISSVFKCLDKFFCSIVNFSRVIKLVPLLGSQIKAAAVLNDARVMAEQNLFQLLEIELLTLQVCPSAMFRVLPPVRIQSRIFPQTLIESKNVMSKEFNSKVLGCWVLCSV